MRKAASTASHGSTTRGRSRAHSSRWPQRRAERGSSGADQYSHDILRDRLRFEPAVAFVADGPHALFMRVDREFAAVEQLMVDLEARSPDMGHFGDDLDLFAVAGGTQEICARIDERDARDAIGGREVATLEGERDMDELRRRPVEEIEEARV